MLHQSHQTIDMEKVSRGMAWEGKSSRAWARFSRFARAGLLLVVLYLLWARTSGALQRQLRGPPSSRMVQLPHEYAGAYPSHALNQTLGFQNIFVLNLPRRVDRRDMMTLMAMASDVRVDFFDALDGNQTAQLRLPKIDMIEHLRESQYTFTPGQLGCYRSNLNIMQHIVDNRIASALIIQDDADWDEDLRGALKRMQDPFYTLLDSLNPFAERVEPSEAAPWMHEKWDIFWVGGSYERPWPDADTAPYVLYSDESVAHVNFQEQGGKHVFPGYGLMRAQDDRDPQHRLVQQSRRPLGMAAYAVTLAGAAKILARAGQTMSQSYDNTVCAMSRPNSPEGYHKRGCHIEHPIKSQGEAELRSYSVWPPLFSQFRDADGLRDSDLLDDRPHGLHVEGVVGYALEIKHGVRQKIASQAWKWN